MQNRGDSRNNVHLGSNLPGNEQIAMSNNRSFDTQYWVKLTKYIFVGGNI